MQCDAMRRDETVEV